MTTRPSARRAKSQPTRAVSQRGRFISFEGGEGAGKSSQVTRLAERLRGLGLDVLVTREPGGSPGAEAVRHVLLSGAAQAFGPLAEAILFAAARADHVDQTIRPALEAGRWVICDRFLDSSRVYQGLDGAVPKETLALLESLAVGELVPDLTVLLDIPVEIGLRRADLRRGDATIDRFEGEAVEIHESRRRAFLKLAQAEPKRFAVVDAAQEPTAVADAIWYAARTRLALPERG